MGEFAATDPACLAWDEVLDLCVRVIEQSANLQVSPYIIDHTGNTPSHLIDNTFSVEMQTENTDKYRGGDGGERIAHTLTITRLKKLAAKDQIGSQREAIRTGETVARALNEQVATAELRVSFRSEERLLTPDRTYLINRDTFRLEHDWYGQPLGSGN